MELLAAGSIAAAVLVVFGAFVFVGSERCFRILAGGADFLALDPDPESYRRSARLSGATLWLLAAAIWCAMARAGGFLGPAADAPLLAAAGAAGAGVAVLIALQVALYAKLLKGRGRG